MEGAELARRLDEASAIEGQAHYARNRGDIMTALARQVLAVTGAATAGWSAKERYEAELDELRQRNPDWATAWDGVVRGGAAVLDELDGLVPREQLDQVEIPLMISKMLFGRAYREATQARKSQVFAEAWDNRTYAL